MTDNKMSLGYKQISQELDVERSCLKGIVLRTVLWYTVQN